MTQAILDAPNSGDASKRDSRRSVRLDPLARTQILGLYKSDTLASDAAPDATRKELQPPEFGSTVRDPFPNTHGDGFAGEMPDPFPSRPPEPPRNALQRTNPHQVRLIWPATLPVVPVPERDAVEKLLEPAPAHVREESPWLDAVHVPQLRGAIDTSVRLTLLDRMLTSKRFKPALITITTVALLMGVSVLFAFALDSESDEYSPAESELPVKVAPKGAHTTQPVPSKPATPERALPPAAAEHAGPKPGVGAATVTPLRAPGSPHMATRSAPRDAARSRSGSQAARVPWWE